MSKKFGVQEQLGLSEEELCVYVLGYPSEEEWFMSLLNRDFTEEFNIELVKVSRESNRKDTNTYDAIESLING